MPATVRVSESYTERELNTRIGFVTEGEYHLMKGMFRDLYHKFDKMYTRATNLPDGMRGSVLDFLGVEYPSDSNIP